MLNTRTYQGINMTYATALERKVQELEAKVSNLEEIFNTFVDLVFPKEEVSPEEAKELERRPEDILSGKEKPINWREVEKELGD